MIASLHGTVESLGGDWAIVTVGGIGLRVYMPASTMSTIGKIGEDVHLRTHLHLREDNVALYGFATSQEQSLFQTLIGVSGVGPRIALSLLSALSVEQLTMAIATGNMEMLTIATGVGKKLANRIILELKEKISAGWVATPASQLAQENSEVMAALTSLGYSVAEASRAIASLPSSSGLSLEDKIKSALQYFGGK